MKTYFYKELAGNPFYVAGTPVPFEVLDGNRGVLELDTDNPKDQPLIAALNEAADKHRGGIVRINAEKYAQKKSQWPLKPSAGNLAQMLRAMQSAQSHSQRLKEQAAAAAAKKAAPTAPPPPPKKNPVGGQESAPESFKPATRRLTLKQSPGATL